MRTFFRLESVFDLGGAVSYNPRMAAVTTPTVHLCKLGSSHYSQIHSRYAAVAKLCSVNCSAQTNKTEPNNVAQFSTLANRANIL